MSDMVVLTTVKLSGYGWHTLLRELEWGMKFATCDGHNNKDTIILFQNIASQLSDSNVIVKDANARTD